jgi:hypothetical protein
MGGTIAMAFLVLLVAGLYIGSAALLAWWMLEPINRVAGQLQFSTRFVLTDFLGLMTLLQVPLAVVGRAIESAVVRDNVPYWALLAAAVLLVVILWVAAVSVVSRAGIVELWRRLCVIVLLVPGALIVIVLWPLALVDFFSSLASRRLDGGGWGLDILGLPAVALVAIGVRWLSFWSLAGSPGERLLAAMMRHRQMGQPADAVLAAPSPAERID